MDQRLKQWEIAPEGMAALRGLQAYVDIDRDSAGRLGITPAAVDTALYNAFGQRLISTIFTQATQYRVVLEVKPEYRAGPDALRGIYVAGANNVQVPLAAIARFSTGHAPLAINRIGQFPAAAISFNLAPGYSLGHAVDAIQRVEREIGLPASVQTEFQDAAAPWNSVCTLGGRPISCSTRWIASTAWPSE